VGTVEPLAFLGAACHAESSASAFGRVGSRFDATGRSLPLRPKGLWTVCRVRGRVDGLVHPRHVAGRGDGWLDAALGFYFPGLAEGVGRAAVVTTLTLALGAINLRGHQAERLGRESADGGELVPLAVFVVAGLLHVDPT